MKLDLYTAVTLHTFCDYVYLSSIKSFLLLPIHMTLFREKYKVSSLLSTSF